MSSDQILMILHELLIFKGFEVASLKHPFNSVYYFQIGRFFDDLVTNSPWRDITNLLDWFSLAAENVLLFDTQV